MTEPKVYESRITRFLAVKLAVVLPILVLFLLSFPTSVQAQRYRWQDDGFDYRRVAALPDGMEKMPEVIVCEFFAHGAITKDVPSIAVYGARDQAPSRILQSGPGDFARIAFEPNPKESRYYLYYGGKSKTNTPVPKWTSKSGLFFETRHWKDVNVNSLDSVRQSFDSSTPFGSDFVGGVFHRHNPFATDMGPFLSHYIGILNVPVTGEYAFYTSSQDCSFLLIDEKEIISAPGRHPPESRAKTKGTVELIEGPHLFEYYHAAVGDETCAVAAWQIPGQDAPSKIAPEMFRYDRVLRIPPVQLEHRESGFLPDFRMAILGDIPSTDPAEPAMVRTQFVDASPAILTTAATYQWDFGDGQTSEYKNPGHVFLHPGEYKVALKVTRGSKEPAISNQVYVTRQFIVDSKGQEGQDLTAYLETLEQYNSANLDAVGLVQLVRTYTLAEDWVNASQAAQAAFVPGAKGHDDKSRWFIAQMVGPALQDRLDNPKAAAKIWTEAAALIKEGSLRSAAAVRAADVLLNDLLDVARARKALSFVEENIGQASPLTRSKYYRILGDWYARTGNRTEARSSYLKADATRELEYNSIQMTTWRGAHARSAEAFLRSDELQRAKEELDTWQTDFPADKIDGYFSLMMARYFYERKKYDQAISVTNDLLVVNPNSPYADRLVGLAATCEEAQDRIPRAVAVYQSLIVDYPGSPMVDFAKKEIVRLMTPKETKGGKKK